jgi:hypothetical protein
MKTAQRNASRKPIRMTDKIEVRTIETVFAGDLSTVRCCNISIDRTQNTEGRITPKRITNIIHIMPLQPWTFTLVIVAPIAAVSARHANPTYGNFRMGFKTLFIQIKVDILLLASARCSPKL